MKVSVNGHTHKKSEITDFPTNISAFTNDAGYKTTDTTYTTATSNTLGLVKIGYAANGKNYPVQLSNGQMYVNVPWTDTDTNTWRPITDSYSGTDSNTSLSQKGGNDIYNALVNGYASSAGKASTATKLTQAAGANDDACMPSGGNQFQVFTTSAASGERGGADGHIMAFTCGGAT